MQHFAVFLLDKRSFVSGSNSRFLSSDVVTEFRGRGDEIRIWPLTFDEYFNGIGGDIRKAWLDYYTFGGLPQVALLETEEKKTDYLRGLYETTYLRDVIERNHLRNPEGMKELVRVIASLDWFVNQSNENSQYLSICTRGNHKKRHYKTIH